MERENKDFKTKATEFSQKIDVITSGVALAGSAVGLIPIGFTVAFIGFNALTYFGAEVFKKKNKD